jgi:hypothetical protein
VCRGFLQLFGRQKVGKERQPNKHKTTAVRLKLLSSKISAETFILTTRRYIFYIIPPTFAGEPFVAIAQPASMMASA